MHFDEDSSLPSSKYPFERPAPLGIIAAELKALLVSSVDNSVVFERNISVLFERYRITESSFKEERSGGTSALLITTLCVFFFLSKQYDEFLSDFPISIALGKPKQQKVVVFTILRFCFSNGIPCIEGKISCHVSI